MATSRAVGWPGGAEIDLPGETEGRFEPKRQRNYSVRPETSAALRDDVRSTARSR